MSLEKLDEVIEELEAQSKTFKKYNEAYCEIVKIKENISNSNSILKGASLVLDESSKNIKEEIKNLNTEVSVGYESIKKINIENQKKIENILEGHSRSNKLFYQDLSGEIYSRLEKMKLDLQINMIKNNELLENKTKQYLDQNVELISKVYDEKQKMLGKKINKMQLFIMFLLFVNISILFTMFLVMKY